MAEEQTPVERREATQRLTRAHKAQHAQAIADGTADPAELVAIRRLERDLETEELLEELREMTAEPWPPTGRRRRPDGTFAPHR